MNRINHIALFAFTFLAVFCLTGCAPENNKTSGILFFDNATFENFSDDKLEWFVIEEEINVKFTFEGKIEAGEFLVSVCSESGDQIFETKDLVYNDAFTKKLRPGKYSYLLKLVNCKNGKVYNKAEIVN